MESDQYSVEAPSLPESGSADQPVAAKRMGKVATKSRKRRRFEIDIFGDWCKCCGICAAFCPCGCIRLDSQGAPTLLDSDKCTGCGWCELHCPDFAISVHEKNGPAEAQNRGDLPRTARDKATGES